MGLKITSETAMPTEAEQLIQSQSAIELKDKEKEVQQAKVMEMVKARNISNEEFFNKYNFTAASQLAQCIMYLQVERNSIRIIEGEQAYKLVEIVIAILDKRFDEAKQKLIESTFKVERLKQS